MDFPHCAKRYSVGGGLIKKAAADAFVLVLKKQIAKKMSMEFIMRASRNCKRSFVEYVSKNTCFCYTVQTEN